MFVMLLKERFLWSSRATGLSLILVLTARISVPLAAAALPLATVICVPVPLAAVSLCRFAAVLLCRCVAAPLCR